MRTASTPMTSSVAAAGVALGSALWFTLLAHWIAKLPRAGRVARVVPKIAMAHNVVVLAKGTNLDAFVNASAMARSTNFIAPAFAKSVIADTGMGGAGDTVQVTFTAPKAPGRYDFVCSFPGHFAGGMRGVLVVK